MKKFIIFLVMGIVIIVGAVCGFKTYAAVKETGRVVGEIEHYNPYFNFNKFGYDLTGESFYESSETTGIYEIIKEYPVPNEEVDFNGQSFDVIINNKPCYNVKVYERVIFAETELSFANLYGYDIGSIKLNVQFEYWVDKTVVKITVPDCLDIARLNTYLDIYGLKIRIIEGQHESWQYDDSKERVKIMYFDGCDNLIELTSVNVYENKTVRDVYSQLPELSLPGFELEGWSNLSTATDIITDSELNKVFTEELGGYSYTFYPIFKGVGNYGLYDSNNNQVMSLENLVKNGYLFYYGDNAVKTMSSSSQVELTGNLVLPKGITSLEIFDSRLNITNIDIPDTVTSLCITGSCEDITELEFPGSVTDIVLMSGLTNLQNIYIPDTVTTIYQGAFTGLDINIFCSCEKDNIPYGYYFGESDTVYYGFSHENYLIAREDIEHYFKYGVFTAGGHLLYTWQDLIDKGYIKVTGTTLKANSSFKDLAVDVLKVSDSITELESFAFYNCKKLYKVELPDTVIKIENEAFLMCTYMTSIILSNNLTTIGSGVFNSCRYLESIEIPNSVTLIGDLAFSSCSRLRTIKLPNTVKEILNLTFSYCYELTEVVIPNSVTKIWNKAFESCPKLSSIYIPSTVLEVEADAFLNTTIAIYCGASSKLAGYKFTNSAVCGYTYSQYLSAVRG